MKLAVNPFTPNAPIDDPARFSGREVELGRIIDALFQTAQNQPHHAAITGARGIGKTSVLHMAAKVAKGDRELVERVGVDTASFRFNMVTAIHTATRGESVEEVSTALLRQLQRELQLRKFETKEIHWELDLKLFKVGGSAGPQIIPALVDQLLDRIESVSTLLALRGMNGLLLMIDELDQVTQPVGGADAASSGFGPFFKVLSEKLVTRNLKNVGICVSGVEGFLQALAAEHPSVERVFRDVPIPPLTDAQATQIINDALGRIGSTIEPEASARIVKLSGRYPEPVHLIGSEVVSVDSDGHIDVSDVEQALDRVVRIVRRNYLKNIISKANSGRDQQILRAMAGLPGEVKAVSDISKEIGHSPQAFGSNMTRLNRTGIVTRQKKGMYRFTEPLLEIYIDRVGVGDFEEEEEDE